MANGNFAGGDGAESNPYLIEDAFDLDAIRNNLTAHYKLINDIDMNVSPFNTGAGWNPIGEESNPFSGVFDGNGKSIENPYMKRTESTSINRVYYGLFGDVRGLVKNFNLKDVNFDITLNGSGTFGYIGAVAGEVAHSKGLYDVKATGVIRVSSRRERMFSGGFVGLLSYTHTKNCYSTVTVSYSFPLSLSTYEILRLGGFVGYTTQGSIKNSYSTGAVNASNSSYITKGGFSAHTSNADISNCFWDRQTSGLSYSEGGIGLTTEQMKTSQTFLNANWHEEKSDNGRSSWILSDGEYPSLWFESEPIYSLIYHNGVYQTWDGEKLIEVSPNPTSSEYVEHGIEFLSIVPPEVLDDIKPFEIVSYSNESQELQAEITFPASIYNQQGKSYQGIGIIETEMEDIFHTIKSLWISAEHNGCTFQYSRNNGESWHDAELDKVIDISGQTGNQLIIRVSLPSTSSELTSLAYGWA